MRKLLRVILICCAIILIAKSTDWVIAFTLYAKIFDSNTDGVHPEFMTGLINERIIFCTIASLVIFLSNIKPTYWIATVLVIDLIILIITKEIDNSYYLYQYFTNRFLTYRIWFWLSIAYCVYFSKYIKDKLVLKQA